LKITASRFGFEFELVEKGPTAFENIGGLSHQISMLIVIARWVI
jgi:hypothetical protein